VKTPASLLPDILTLQMRLTSALANSSSSRQEVNILDRSLPAFMSTFPNEIVTCEFAGRKHRLFLKHSGARSHHSFGHRGDVSYEAQVYEHLLRRLPDFRPKCFGSQMQKGQACIILEYIDGSVRVSDLTYNRIPRQQRALVKSLQWLAQFHTQHETQTDKPSLAFLKRYDRAYFRGWANRTLKFSRPLRGRFPWLRQIARTGDAWFAPLLKCPSTVIHGEFYAKTLLLRGGEVFILDWESAAMAAGEIDLATLTEGEHWPDALVRMCERAYVKARWPQGAPPTFGATLNAARIYLHFRWLGERAEWALRPKTLWRYEKLHSALMEAALI
jgi:hypothetical protein